MNSKDRCRGKHVHDIQVQDMNVRLWSVDGPTDRQEIQRMLAPLAKTGFVHPYMALMPDWHPGSEGSIVGSVIPTRSVLLPGMIGGDIGCGMIAVRLPVTTTGLAEHLESIALGLRTSIPSGSGLNTGISDRVQSNPIWRRELKAPVSNRTLRKLIRQFASLGGGNHFLEVQNDSDGYVWVMLHSGSRYLGMQVRDWYIEQGAKQPGIDTKVYSRIPYLLAESDLAHHYLADTSTVQEFARESRKEMMTRALETIGTFLGTLDIALLIAGAIEVGHNYVAVENHFGERLLVHRKGAIQISKGALGLVPGSMGTPSYVVEGRGNPFSFCSCAHGGGRAMSRSAAARRISEKTLRESMKNVVYDSEVPLLDEAPEAYKDIRMVMRGQKDLVKIRHELNPVVSVKGR
jgi:tRNA-splicing ligase RtcB (3'-phosphate/5'-hydroxy nucleic acid ligase)